MSFNSEFWVTVGTTAPVIALSCILLINDQAGIISDKKAGKARLFRSHGTASEVASISYVINWANLTFQWWVLYNALYGLATGNALPLPFTSERAIGVAESFSVLLLLASTFLLTLSRIAIKRDEARRLAQERKEAEQLALRQLSISNSRKVFRAATFSRAKRVSYRRRGF